MKREKLNKNFAKILMFASLATSTACVNSKMGSGVQEGSPGVVESGATHFEIEPYTGTSASLVSRSLSSDNTALEFIDNVDRAVYAFSGSKLRINLYDVDGIKITIPGSFASSSKYKSTSEFILISLSNGEAKTSLVIHKESGKAFITKDTQISEISLSGTSGIAVNYQDEEHAVLKVSAKVNSTTKSVGLLFLQDAMLALRL